MKAAFGKLSQKKKKTFLLGITQIGGTPLPKLIWTLFQKWKSCPKSVSRGGELPKFIFTRFILGKNKSEKVA